MTSAVREFRLEDVNHVTGMVRGSFDRRFWPFMAYAQQGIAEFLSVALRFPTSAPRNRSYVSVGPGGVEGFADFRVTSDEEAFLSYICVMPQARGRGVATSLIEQFLANHPKLEHLRLDVFRENAPAIAMYSKLGFEREHSSIWVTRPMPPARGAAEIVELSKSLAALHLYGFCELEVSSAPAPAPAPVRLGILGNKVVNCRTPEVFQNDTLLAALRNTFEDAETAFAVIAESEVLQISVVHSVINETDRMSLDISGVNVVRGART